jgi:serine/threonine protein kinase, bacterial
MPLAPGATFAGYTIVQMLGTGGVGEVYLAQHPQLQRRDALKVLPRAMTAYREFRARFTREAEIAATLYHPHIVEVHDRGEFEGQLWIAMDYVDGTDAAQLVRERFPAGVPASEVLAIVTAVAGALDYAHQRGMLHRDVKPANIFLTNPYAGEQRILLADFGIARPLDEASRRTTTNLTAGAVAYAAPEQLTGSHIDGRADQYGLAATAFHLLTGAPPYQDSSPATVISRHLSAAPAKLSDRHPELERLDAVMSKALANNPADRFGSCGEFADALSACVSIGDRSPEAVLAVDYPAYAEPETARGGSAPVSSGSSPRSVSSRSLAPRLAWWRRERPAATAAPTGRRWRWILLGSATGAALVLLISLLVVNIMILRKTQAPPAQPAAPTTSAVAAPPRVPTTSGPAVPPPGQTLEGSYRADFDRSQQTYNGTPDPQPPDVSTWWAFRSSCTSTSCVATGIMLDDKDHLAASTPGGGRPIVLDFRDGGWQSRPETTPFACRGPNGTPATQTTTLVLSLQAQAHGPMRGVMTVTVQSNECGQQGAHILVPVVATRTGDVPPGVTVPGPAAATGGPAAPTTETPAAPAPTPTR